MNVVGWDIGGVNTKAAIVQDGIVQAVIQTPYEIQRAPARLASLLVEIAARLGAAPDTVHAVTMTAELSQTFRTKREGVGFVLDAVEGAFRGAHVQVFTTDARFLTVSEARLRPFQVAAANWMATATLVAAHHPNALLVDIGTTTTDVIPISHGCVAVVGHTDPERLASGELVYTGTLRTPVEAMAAEVTIGDRVVGVSAEGFALAGDVHLWRGDLNADDYTVPTPDGRGVARAFVRERLARVVCGDRELLDDQAISDLAGSLADAQVARITAAIRRVADRHPHVQVAIVTGLGAFIATASARAAGLEVSALSAKLGAAGARCAPAAAVALLQSVALSSTVARQ